MRIPIAGVWAVAAPGVVLVCALAAGSEGARAAVELPEGFEIVTPSATEGALPPAIRDRRHGVIYRLVPAGKYQIGDGRLADSRRIDVALDYFYIAKLPMTYGDVASYLRDRYASEEARIGALVARLPDSTADAMKRDCTLRATLAFLVTLRRSWPLDMRLSLDDELLLLANLDWVLPSAWSDGHLGEAHGGASAPQLRALSEQQRAVAIHLRDSYVAAITATGDRGRKPYGTAYFNNAVAVATWLGAGLPTEAQWEAARQVQSGDLRGVDNMLSDHWLEWCGDRYAYDYFSRRGDFVDPHGPSVGRLSGAESRGAGSKPALLTRILGLDAGVLRGGSVSGRSFALRATSALGFDRFTQPKGIRPVLTRAQIVRRLIPSGQEAEGSNGKGGAADE